MYQTVCYVKEVHQTVVINVVMDTDHQLLLHVVVKVVMMILMYSDNYRISPFLVGLFPVSITPTPSHPPDKGGRGESGINIIGLVGKIFLTAMFVYIKYIYDNLT